MDGKSVFVLLVVVAGLLLMVSSQAVVIQSGVQTFIGLFDTPDSYVGQANKIVTVNTDENGLTFKDANALPDVNNANFLQGHQANYFVSTTQLDSNLSGKVDKNGDTMTGKLFINADLNAQTGNFSKDVNTLGAFNVNSDEGFPNLSIVSSGSSGSGYPAIETYGSGLDLSYNDLILASMISDSTQSNFLSFYSNGMRADGDFNANKLFSDAGHFGGKNNENIFVGLVDDMIDFNGSGGTTNQTIRFDLDGAKPQIIANNQATKTIEFPDNVIIMGGTTSVNGEVLVVDSDHNLAKNYGNNIQSYADSSNYGGYPIYGLSFNVRLSDSGGSRVQNAGGAGFAGLVYVSGANRVAGTLTGGDTDLQINSNATIGDIVGHTARGLYSYPTKTPVISSVTGFRIRPSVVGDANVIGTGNGLNVEAWTKNTGYVNTLRAIYLEKQTIGNTNWQLYSVDGNMYNGGDLFLGGTAGTETISDTNFRMAEDGSAFLANSLGVEKSIYTDGNISINGAKIFLRADGNITMTSPNGTIGNCGMTDTKVFQCS